ncbi:Uncharacterised protein [Bordetella pertussis]|nr:Uncharacterised protein [Bordetella pertussis]CPL70868.1 Uncharacterised protein [Bordetella pertussis]CPO27381.1 Uncharacterised protein [Bordetella pertussis]
MRQGLFHRARHFHPLRQHGGGRDGGDAARVAVAVGGGLPRPGAGLALRPHQHVDLVAGTRRRTQHQRPLRAARQQGVGGRGRAAGVDAAVGLPLRQANVLDHDQVGLRQHQFQRGGQQVVGVVLVGGILRQRRALAQVQHQRHVAVVGGDLRGHAGCLGRQQRADLDGLHRHVFQQAACLVVEQFGGHRVDFFDAGRVLHGQRGDRGQGVAAQPGATDCVGGQAIGAGRIHGADNENEGRRNGVQDRNDGEKGVIGPHLELAQTLPVVFR